MMWSPLPLLEARGVRIIPSGSDRYRCRCPVHNGDNLSMGITRKDSGWVLHCFACGFGGGTPDLVMALENVNLANAMRFLDGKPSDEACPVELHPRDYFALVCDRCGEARKVEGASYKVPGKLGQIWETTPIEEVFASTSHGWEISAHAEFALCPTCLDSAGSGVTTGAVAGARRDRGSILGGPDPAM